MNIENLTLEKIQEVSKETDIPTQQLIESLNFNQETNPLIRMKKAYFNAFNGKDKEKAFRKWKRELFKATIKAKNAAETKEIWKDFCSFRELVGTDENIKSYPCLEFQVSLIQLIIFKKWDKFSMKEIKKAITQKELVEIYKRTRNESEAQRAVLVEICLRKEW